MNWLNPLAGWWLLSIPALLALYMLRAKPVRRPVSSLRLWRNLPDIDKPRARVRKPPLSLLLLLQALLLVAGAVALMKPALSAPATDNTIVLLDASGSMQAANGGSTRFEAAKSQAKNIASGMGVASRVTVLRVGPTVQTLCGGCSPTEAAKSLDAVKVGAGKADWPGALSVAAGLAASAPGDTQTVVVSDGSFSALPAEALPPILRYVPVGSDEGNRAITEISARRPPDGSPGYSAYVRIDNFSRAASLTVHAKADTVPQPDRTLDLPADGHADLVWKLPNGTASFTVSIDGNDALNADNSAVLFLPGTGHNVFISAPQTDLYTRVLASIPGLTPATAGSSAQGDTAFTIVQGSPTGDLPLGSLLLVSPQNSVITPTGTYRDARAQVGSPAHSLLGGVDLRALSVQSGQTYEPPAWLETVLDSDKGPLILAGERGGQRIVVFTFDPANSNLPKLAAFPLLMSNVAGWLYPLAGTEALRPGEALRLQPNVTVNLPGNRTAQAAENGAFSDTETPGVYEVAPGTASAVQFAVNMAGTGESDLRVQPHPELSRTNTGDRQDQVVGAGLWSPLVACALLLMGAEWLFYSWKRGRA